MNRRNLAVLSVAVAAVVLCTGFTYLAYPEDERTYVGSPWINSNLYGNIPSERPSPVDDAYLWANHEWLSAVELPSYIQSHHGNNHYTVEAADNLISAIEEGHGTAEGRVLKTILDMYRDWDTRGSLGDAPLIRYIDEVMSADTAEELVEHLANDSAPMPGCIAVSQDYDRFHGLVPGVSAFVLNDTSGNILDVLTELLGSLGLENARGIASDALSVFSGLSSYTKTDLPLRELDDAVVWPVAEILRGYGATDDSPICCVGIEDFLYLDSMLNADDLHRIKAYIVCCYAIFSAPYLDRDTSDVFYQNCYAWWACTPAPRNTSANS